MSSVYLFPTSANFPGQTHRAPKPTQTGVFCRFMTPYFAATSHKGFPSKNPSSSYFPTTANCTGASGKPPEPSKPSLVRRFLEVYVDAMYEGSLKERWPCARYCERKWSQLPPESKHTRGYDAFMKDCKEDCEWFKRECEFSRLN